MKIYLKIVSIGMDDASKLHQNQKIVTENLRKCDSLIENYGVPPNEELEILKTQLKHLQK